MVSGTTLNGSRSSWVSSFSFDISSKLQFVFLQPKSLLLLLQRRRPVMQQLVQPALGLSAELILNMGVAHDGASAI